MTSPSLKQHTGKCNRTLPAVQPSVAFATTWTWIQNQTKEHARCFGRGFFFFLSFCQVKTDATEKKAFLVCWLLFSTWLPGWQGVKETLMCGKKAPMSFKGRTTTCSPRFLSVSLKGSLFLIRYNSAYKVLYHASPSGPSVGKFHVLAWIWLSIFIEWFTVIVCRHLYSDPTARDCFLASHNRGVF